MNEEFVITEELINEFLDPVTAKAYPFTVEPDYPTYYKYQASFEDETGKKYFVSFFRQTSMGKTVRLITLSMLKNKNTSPKIIVDQGSFIKMLGTIIQIYQDYKDTADGKIMNSFALDFPTTFTKYMPFVVKVVKRLFKSQPKLRLELYGALPDFKKSVVLLYVNPSSHQPFFGGKDADLKDIRGDFYMSLGGTPTAADATTSDKASNVTTSNAPAPVDDLSTVKTAAPLPSAAVKAYTAQIQKSVSLPPYDYSVDEFAPDFNNGSGVFQIIDYYWFWTFPAGSFKNLGSYKLLGVWKADKESALAASFAFDEATKEYLDKNGLKYYLHIEEIDGAKDRFLTMADDQIFSISSSDMKWWNDETNSFTNDLDLDDEEDTNKAPANYSPAELIKPADEIGPNASKGSPSKILMMSHYDDNLKKFKVATVVGMFDKSDIDNLKYQFTLSDENVEDIKASYNNKKYVLIVIPQEFPNVFVALAVTTADTMGANPKYFSFIETTVNKNQPNPEPAPEPEKPSAPVVISLADMPPGWVDPDFTPNTYNIGGIHAWQLKMLSFSGSSSLTTGKEALIYGIYSKNSFLKCYSQFNILTSVASNTIDKDNVLYVMVVKPIGTQSKFVGLPIYSTDELKNNKGDRFVFMDPVTGKYPEEAQPQKKALGDVAVNDNSKLVQDLPDSYEKLVLNHPPVEFGPIKISMTDDTSIAGVAGRLTEIKAFFGTIPKDKLKDTIYDMIKSGNRLQADLNDNLNAFLQEQGLFFGTTSPKNVVSAVQSYTGSAYRSINSYLRFGKSTDDLDDEQCVAKINLIDQGFAKEGIRLPAKLTVYRGASITNDQVKELQNLGRIPLTGYASVSLNTSTAYSFGSIYGYEDLVNSNVTGDIINQDVHSNAGNKILYSINRLDRCLSIAVRDISKFAPENEIILNRGTEVQMRQGETINKVANRYNSPENGVYMAKVEIAPKAISESSLRAYLLREAIQKISDILDALAVYQFYCIDALQSLDD